MSALARAAALLALPPLDPTTTPAAHGAAATAVRGEIAAARAAALSLAESGAYERAEQAARVVEESAARMALARLQLQQALADLPATLTALDPTPE